MYQTNKKSSSLLNGFTLVELLMSVAIFTVLIAMVMVVITTAHTTYFSADARIITQQDMRKALNVMFHELSESNQYRVYIPSGDTSQVVLQIPIKVNDGGALQGRSIDDRNNIIFGSRPLPSTDPNGTPDYALHYLLVPNNDISNSKQLIRRVLDSYPNGNQVGNDLVVANWVDTIQFSKNGKILSIAISTVKNNKYSRNMRITGNFGVTLRN